MSNPCKIVGVKGEECESLKGFLAQVCPSKPKKKRRASRYNMYIKACFKSKGGVKKFGQAGPLMKICASEYKEDKQKGKFRYELEVPEESTQEQSPVLWKGRDLTAEWQALYKKLTG